MSGPAEQIEWYLARDGQQYGPVSDTELKKIIELGHLRPQDLVWRDGFPEWREAGSVFEAELSRRPADPPQPPPQPPAPPEATDARPQSPSSSGAHDDAARGPAAAASQEHPHGPGAGAPRHAAQGPREPQEGDARHARGDHGREASDRFAPRDRREVVSGPQVNAPIAAAQRRERLAPDDVRWDESEPGPAAQSARREPTIGSANTEIRRPADYGADLEDDAVMPPAAGGRSTTGRVLLSILMALVAGVLATVGWLMYTNSDALDQLYGQISGISNAQPAVVRAPDGASREAPAGASGGGNTSPPQQAAAVVDRREPDEVKAPGDADQQSPPATAASPLLATPLWQAVNTSLPQEAAEIQQKVNAMQSANASAEDISATLIQSLIRLRRNNADAALSAPAANLGQIADAFVRNLKYLRQNSVAACYGFIAEGDMNAAVSPLLTDAQRVGPLLQQHTAVFNAIAAGKASPVTYDAPKKEDFDALSAELVNRGWSQSDLQLFSDPQALSRAPQDQVCRLVTEWFETQLALPAGDRKMRLLTASLRPVVAG